MNSKIICGDVLESLRTLDKESVNCVITSPPYWQLRDYGWDDQWGLESTFWGYLDHMWTFMDEIKRVLTPDGTVWVNLGDTYNSSRAGNKEQTLDDRANGGERVPKQVDKSIKEKCLVLVPHRFAIGCIDRGWILRNDIIWAKRSGMPEPVTDRFTKRHEYIFFMVKNKNYYFDLNAIRDTQKPVTILRSRYGKTGQPGHNYKELEAGDSRHFNPMGKNPGTVSDFWDIPIKGSTDAHFASFNTDLIKKPILAGCPEGGTILDPFCGSGTTGVLSVMLNRKFIGIDGKQEYVDLTKQKIQEAELNKKNFDARTRTIDKFFD